MIKRLDQKIALISLGALIAGLALALNSYYEFLHLKQHAQWQLRDARQGILNADFDIGLLRAAGETVAFALSGSPGYRDEAETDLRQANNALEALQNTLGDGTPEGLESKHLALIKRQREVLAMAKTGLATAQRQGLQVDMAGVHGVLNAVQAYAPLAESLRRDAAAHRELEFAHNERELQRDLNYTAFGFTGLLLLFVGLSAAIWMLVRRLLLVPIRDLVLAAKGISKGEFNQALPITNRDEIGQLQSAFNQMMGDISMHNATLTARNATLARAVEIAGKAEERLQLALDGSGLALWDLDVSTGVIYISSRWAAMLGEEEKETIVDLQARLARIHPDDIGHCRMLIERCRDGLADTLETEHRVRTATGDWIWVHARGRVVQSDAAGRAVRMAGTFANVSERKQVERELQQSQEQLRNFAATLNATIEEDRAWIARELHDELGQVFTGLDMELAWLKGEIQDSPTQSNTQILQDRIATMAEAIDGAMTVVRRIAKDLRPPLLDNLGLVAALEALAMQFQERTGVRCETDFDTTLVLDRFRSTALFRVCQEAMTNITRHANATLVEVFFGRKDDTTLVFEVSDDGGGISALQAADPHSVGLTGMRERARLISGTLEIRGTPGEGTTVRLEFPELRQLTQ